MKEKTEQNRKTETYNKKLKEILHEKNDDLNNLLISLKLLLNFLASDLNCNPIYFLNKYLFTIKAVFNFNIIFSL